MSEQYPVTVAVRRPDGSVEQVRVGMAVEAYAVEFEPGLALPFWRPA